MMLDLPFGSPVYRDRYPTKTSPYDPDSTVIDYGAAPDTVSLSGYVASSSSSSRRDATRKQILTEKSLFLTDLTADVRVGDRIRSGTHTYQVEVLPESDVNPFTGWRPYIEVPLEEVLG